MNLSINGVQFGEYLTKYGYSVSYKKILGVNSTTTLDGKYHEDILAWKTIVVAEIRPLKSDKLATLIDACNKETVAVTYFDTRTNKYVSKTMIPELSQASLALVKTNFNIWNGGSGGITLTLEEQ